VAATSLDEIRWHNDPDEAPAHVSHAAGTRTVVANMTTHPAREFANVASQTSFHSFHLVAKAIDGSATEIDHTIHETPRCGQGPDRSESSLPEEPVT
jgi:hypothetical protein